MLTGGYNLFPGIRDCKIIGQTTTGSVYRLRCEFLNDSLETRCNRGKESGRGERDRTSDLGVPSAARYQTALHPDRGKMIIPMPGKTTRQSPCVFSKP